MRYLLLVFVAIASFNTAFAKKNKFASQQEAVSVIQATTARYWEKLDIKDNKENVVKVTLQDGKLIFTQTATYVRPATIGRETFTETKIVTVEVDLTKAAVSPTVSNYTFLEQSKNAIHQVVAWNKSALDNSNTFIGMYTIPLDYPALIKNGAELERMKDAVRYLSKIYLPKPANKKFSLRVGH